MKLHVKLAPFVLMVFGYASFASFGQRPPSDLFSNRNIAAFSNRAEGSLLSEFQQETPIAEGYFQWFVPDEKLGYILDHDRYILGRILWRNGPTIENLLEFADADNSTPRNIVDDQQLLNGLVDMLTPDWRELSSDRYSYTYAGTTFLGSMHCMMFDVQPVRPEDAGFKGRLYFEDELWNLVRFTGMSSSVDDRLFPLRGTNSRFRIDSWRVNIEKNRWVPAYTYVEEVPPLNTKGMPVVKAQIRYWGYDRGGAGEHPEHTKLVLTRSPSTDAGGGAQWSSPQQSQRLFETQAEQNVLQRLFDAKFLGTSDRVEKDLDQVLTNLIASDRLALGEPIHCRILLTTPLEAFIVGNTIVLSRGLIDSAPSESALALVIAHQLAHYALGHARVDSGLAFADVLNISDAELLAKLRFRHSDIEEVEADKMAIDIIGHSPYAAGANSMSEAGLYMQALRFHAPQLTALIRPNFGEHIADIEHVVRNDLIVRTSPVLDLGLPGQVAALPLGSRLVMDPRDGRVELSASNGVLVPTPRERAELAVTPFMPTLEYFLGNKDADKVRQTASTELRPRKRGTAIRVAQAGLKKRSVDK